MNYKNLLYEEKEKIAKITINRPDKLNALSIETIDELGKVFWNCYNNHSVRVVILTGAGEKAFCAGADISELVNLTPLEAKNLTDKMKCLGILIENLGKPVIAAVNGYALGGGCEISQMCHLRIASENAKFGQPEVNLGLIPGFGGSQRLPRIVGKAKAMELILTGEIITAQEAYRIGLVNKVVPLNELMNETMKLAYKLIDKKAPLAIKYSIEAINRGEELKLSDAIDVEKDLFSLIFTTKDAKEGLKAFLEKRPPNFEGI